MLKRYSNWLSKKRQRTLIWLSWFFGKVEASRYWTEPSLLHCKPNFIRRLIGINHERLQRFDNIQQLSSPLCQWREVSRLEWRFIQLICNNSLHNVWPRVTSQHLSYPVGNQDDNFVLSLNVWWQRTVLLLWRVRFRAANFYSRFSPIL